MGYGQKYSGSASEAESSPHTDAKAKIVLLLTHATSNLSQRIIKLYTRRIISSLVQVGMLSFQHGKPAENYNYADDGNAATINGYPPRMCLSAAV